MSEEKIQEIGEAHGMPQDIIDAVKGVALADKLIDTEAARAAAAKAKKPELPNIGHNSEISGNRLKSFIERVERLSEEKRALSEDISDIYKEAKGTGFDAPTIRKIVALRKKNLEKRREEAELLDLYMAAINMPE
jgi:uncharacterized protein (UPF0335 family)